MAGRRLARAVDADTINREADAAGRRGIQGSVHRSHAMRIEAVIFDWGGTLTRWHDVDFHAESLALAQAVRRTPTPTTTTTRYAARLHRAGDVVWGRSRDHQQSSTIADLFTEAGLDHDPDLLQAYYDFWEPHTLTDPEVRPMFEELRATGLKVGVLSNTIWPRAWHVGFFERDGVYDLIDGDVYTSEIPWTKPSPRAFEAAMEAVGVTDPAACVYVGDRLFDDVWGAHNAGLRAIHIPLSAIPAEQVGHTEGDARRGRAPRCRDPGGRRPALSGLTHCTLCNFVRCTNMQVGDLLSHPPDRMHDCACGSTTPTGGAPPGDADQPHKRSASSAVGEDLGTSPRARPRAVSRLRVGLSQLGRPAGLRPAASSSCHGGDQIAPRPTRARCRPTGPPARAAPRRCDSSVASAARLHLRRPRSGPSSSYAAAAATGSPPASVDEQPQLVAARAVASVGRGEGVVERRARRTARCGRRARRTCRARRARRRASTCRASRTLMARPAAGRAAAAACCDVEAAMLASTRARSPLRGARQPARTARSSRCSERRTARQRGQRARGARRARPSARRTSGTAPTSTSRCAAWAASDRVEARRRGRAPPRAAASTPRRRTSAAPRWRPARRPPAERAVGDDVPSGAAAGRCRTRPAPAVRRAPAQRRTP